MIVRIFSAGKSFKGLGHYLTHDAGADTTERVAWTHTLNCANDHVPSAIHEMYGTYLDAELLKEEAGIRKGGRPLCQTALNIDPGSASNFDPPDGYGGTSLISPAKRVGVAQPG